MESPANPAPSPARSFDPRRVGRLECRAWVTYYRREWTGVLVASVGLVRAAFRMSWPRTLRGAWLVLRANQRWAPYPDNDPDGARRYMERFYRLLARSAGLDGPNAMAGENLDTVEAARLEVEWWRAHRESQHGGGADGANADAAVVDAVAKLYAFVYAVPLAAIRPAAELRSEAMAMSDRWVAEGCRMDSPLIAREQSLLVRSYAALLAAVHR